MRTKLLIGSASAVLLGIAAVAIAGAFTKPQSNIPQQANAPQQGFICPVTGEELPCPLCCPYSAPNAPQSTQSESCCAAVDCCPEVLACCAEDGCCWECILWCIEMGCHPLCCFTDATSVKAEAPKASEACCADAKGCCVKPAPKKATGCCTDGCCK